MQIFNMITSIFFVINFFNIWIIGILYNVTMHNMEFGEAYCKELAKRIPTKFILYFLSFNPFSMYFRNIMGFLEI
jgi:hypothetical protein